MYIVYICSCKPIPALIDRRTVSKGFKRQDLPTEVIVAVHEAESLLSSTTVNVAYCVIPTAAVKIRCAAVVSAVAGVALTMYGDAPPETVYQGGLYVFQPT